MARPDRAVPADAGLQAERTALAWQRSALAACVNAGLLLRAGCLAQSLGLVACAGLMLALAAAMGLFAWQRDQTLLCPQPLLRLQTRSMHILCVTLLACCLIAAAAQLTKL